MKLSPNRVSRSEIVPLVLVLALLAAACTTGGDHASTPASATAPAVASETPAPTRESGGGIWAMLDDSRRRKQARVERDREFREALDAQIARGRTEIPPDQRAKMATWWTQFVNLDDAWLESRFKWRALGPEPRRILVENMLIALIRGHELNQGRVYKRARAELVELGGLSTPYLVSGLAARHGDDVIRDRLVEILGLIGPLALSAIVEAYGGASVQGRLDLVRAAAEMGNLGAPQSTSFFRRVLADEDDYRLRLAALQGLGRTQDPDAIPILIDALDDRDLSVRKFAAASLGVFQDPRAIGALIACLAGAEQRWSAGSREAEVIQICVRSLRQLTDQKFKRAKEWQAWWRRNQRS